MASLAAAAKPAARQQSPPAPSKRDKKRQLLNERLTLLDDQFSRDRDRHYREELQKIQIDVSLVGRVDPYADRPLDAIERSYRELSQQTSSNGANRSLLDMAGPSFQEWVHEIEDLVEHRDYELVTQKHEYDRKSSEAANEHAYRIEVARREHKALSATLRDRLINSITSKKYRLGKEKEALDISDSSALLLHPNQFSLTNPASPGGPHGKRNTRLRREMEDLPGFSDNKKRKRNGGGGGDEDGSPAPTRRPLDATNTTPLWQGERLRGLRKESGPIYSIDKLFTDKELAMTYNTAALAAHKHLLVRRDNNGNILPSPDDSENGNGDGADEPEDEFAAATMMERQPSHTTRSTRGAQVMQQNFYDDKMLGIEGLTNFELPGNLDRMAAQEPKLPPLIHSQYSKAYVKSDSNTPTALSADDASQDFMVMTVLKHYQKANGVGSNLEVNNGGRRLLEAMTASNGAGAGNKTRNAVFLQGQRPSVEALAESLNVPSSSLRDEPLPAGGSAQGGGPHSGAPTVSGGLLSVLGGGLSGLTSSPGGYAGFGGGMPMSRQSSLGGAAMSRSGSARGGKRK
ncbi:Sds3-like-domain-containing protein [Microdochium trichocladiopsis]|uniref:Sds3-like-domain-containing protein n=1 Tax=Microdochium trichocladiopsis TaxID=1682393 RepID=A0A9P8YHQ3_9PEZI|nr:Sds3-like-domain-containing protein [Microdochium trichocladiopsis]KAH7040158.1 Sds3-like-domain-containing protein [Microdochium trichocladiopsis]